MRLYPQPRGVNQVPPHYRNAVSLSGSSEDWSLWGLVVLRTGTRHAWGAWQFSSCQGCPR